MFTTFMFTNLIFTLYLCLQTCYFFQNQLSEQNLKSYMTQILVRWIFLRPSFSLAAETKKGHRFVDLSHQLKKFSPCISCVKIQNNLGPTVPLSECRLLIPLNIQSVQILMGK